MSGQRWPWRRMCQDVSLVAYIAMRPYETWDVVVDETQLEEGAEKGKGQSDREDRTGLLRVRWSGEEMLKER